MSSVFCRLIQLTFQVRPSRQLSRATESHLLLRQLCMNGQSSRSSLRETTRLTIFYPLAFLGIWSTRTVGQVIVFNWFFNDFRTQAQMRGH